MRHRADMVFMAVRQQQRVQRPLLGFDEARIRRDYFDARLGVTAKCDAEIDHNPVAVLACPIAV